MTDSHRLNVLLDEQMDFLGTSCERFDAGHEHEAKRIALTLRVLLHDTPASTSLLQQLGLKDQLLFLDTGWWTQPKEPGKQFAMPTGVPLGMVIIELPGGYAPALGSHPGLPTAARPFEEWWNEDVIRTTDGARTWTRKAFILGQANQEGGAHVDPSPQEWWKSLRDEAYVGAGRMGGDAGIPPGNLVSAVIRQMGYEVIETLRARP